MSILAFVLLACGTSKEAAAPVEPPPAAPTPATPTPTPTQGEGDPEGPDTWTAGIVDVPAKGTGGAITAVRTGSHEGFERIVLEFKGETVPGHHLEYIDRPARGCASGEALEIEGDGLLLVQVQPASGHDDAGAATTPREVKPALSNVRELERSCDFEGVVAYVVGVASPNPYRVFELAQPARLVVDVKR